MGPTSDDFAVAGIAFIRRPNIPEVGGGELIMAHLYPRLRFLNGRWRRSNRGFEWKFDRRQLGAQPVPCTTLAFDCSRLLGRAGAVRLRKHVDDNRTRRRPPVGCDDPKTPKDQQEQQVDAEGQGESGHPPLQRRSLVGRGKAIN